MKVVKEKERTVTITPNEGGFLLVERQRYIRHGYTKASWNEARIWLSQADLDTICRAREQGKLP